MRARVAITGIGVLSPAGRHPGAFFEALLAGRSFTRLVDAFDASAYACRVVAPLPQGIEMPPAAEEHDERLIDRVSHLAHAAAQLAVSDAGLAPGPALEAGAVILGSGFGCIGTVEESLRGFFADGPRAAKAFTIPKGMGSAPAAAISLRLGVRGPHRAVNAACASGTVAIGEAFRMVSERRVPVALAGGAEAPILPSVLAAWCALRVVTRRNDEPGRACRPFSADRDGLVLGEGAAVLVLEEYERARARGAWVYAELCGFGESSDASHLTAPSAEGEARAIELALVDAGRGAHDIDYVNAHGTATPANDRIETEALKIALGEHARRIPVSATKSMIGHSIGACGAIETAATALSLARGAVHPTANFVARDVAGGLDLDYVTEGARRGLALRAALKTSFAFGGANAALVLGRAER
jgi:3-oxoacyl-[acyl-carrier-protein] synthase II